MELNFQKFTDTGKSYMPRASIRASGQLGFSAGAVARLRMAEYKFGILYYEPDHKIIGVKLVREPEEGAIKLRIRSGSADLSAKAFLDRFRIPHQQTKRYDVSWSEEYDMIFIELEKRGDHGVERDRE